MIAQRDPRLRIVLACAFAIVTVTLQQLNALLMALGLAIAMLAIADLPWRQTLKRPRTFL